MIADQDLTSHLRMESCRLLIPLLPLLLLLIVFFSTVTTCYARNNVSKYIEHIGNPYSQYYKKKNNIYARNIWAMIGHKGVIYFGAGNSSNIGPSPNAGPGPIMSYDPKTNSFQSVFLTDDEQIDRFYLFDNILYAPGQDPQEDWNHGNLYLTKDGRQWEKKRTIPLGIHTFSLHFYQNRLFAGLGTGKGAAVAISDDHGTSWDLSILKQAVRIYDFLEVNDQLYAIAELLGNNYKIFLEKCGLKQDSAIFAYSKNKQFVPRVDLTSKELFPDTVLDTNKAYKVTKPRRLGNKSTYLGCYVHGNQSIPFGLYIAKSLEQNNISVEKASLPENAIPWDTYQSEEYVYILTNRNLGSKTEVIILRSNDLKEWEELFYFESPVFARSFTLHQGIFYFSLGCEVADLQHWTADELTEQTGEILKLDLLSVQSSLLQNEVVK